MLSDERITYVQGPNVYRTGQVAELATGMLVGAIRNPGHPAITTSTDAGLHWAPPLDAAGVDTPSCQVSILGLGPNYFWHDALLMAAPWGAELGVSVPFLSPSHPEILPERAWGGPLPVETSSELNGIYRMFRMTPETHSSGVYESRLE